MSRDLLCYDTTNFLKEKTTPSGEIANADMPGGSYRIEGVYQTIFGTENEPTIDRAETSVDMLLRILMNLGDDFLTASKKQSTYFKDVYVGRWCHGHYITHLHCVVTYYHCSCYTSVHSTDSIIAINTDHCCMLMVIFNICTLNGEIIIDEIGFLDVVLFGFQFQRQRCCYYLVIIIDLPYLEILIENVIEEWQILRGYQLLEISSLVRNLAKCDKKSLLVQLLKLLIEINLLRRAKQFIFRSFWKS